MKLRNKKTGEIYDFKITPDYGDVMSGWKIENKDFGVRYYTHLAELNEEWEDYEEPKSFFEIEWSGDVCETDVEGYENAILGAKQIGNYFETKEEAQKAVERLRAWKRLKDKGFKFTGWDRHPDYPGDFRITASDEWTCDDKDLDLLFGGEE